MGLRDLHPFSKIFVLYGRGVQSGGNLAAIQLVDMIRSLGGDAFLLPSKDTERRQHQVDEYRVFNAPEAPFEDHEHNLLIISEYSFKPGIVAKKAHLAVWWLSADKGVPFRVASSFRSRKLPEIRKALKSRVLTGDLYAFLKVMIRRHPYRTLHFAQSAYAQSRVEAAFGIAPKLLGDYLHPEPLISGQADHARTCGKQISYNAKKGGGPKIRKLMPYFPDWNWVPIAGVSPEQAQGILQSSCGFIDLGTLPGRDRLPREARLAGTPVAIAKRGSGEFSQDFPLDSQFLIDFQTNWVQQVGLFLDGLCSSRGRYLEMQKPFLNSIVGDKEKFQAEVQDYFLARGQDG